ncbi:hypothetical protein [Aeromonas veronii]
MTLFQSEQPLALKGLGGAVRGEDNLPVTLFRGEQPLALKGPGGAVRG